MAYRADIEIAVRGAQELKRLQDQISATGKLINGLNNYIENIGKGGSVRSINNLTSAVSQAADAFNKAALGTQEATLAARNFVTANNNLNAGLQERLQLLNNITEAERRQRLAAKGIRETTQYAGPIGPGPASPVGSLVGQKSPVEERLRRIIDARKDELELQQALLRLEEKSAAIANAELQARGKLANLSARGVIAATARAATGARQLALPAFQERGLQLLDNSVKLNQSNLRIEQALNGERARGVRFLEKQSAEEARQVRLGILGTRTNQLPGQGSPLPVPSGGVGVGIGGGRRNGGIRSRLGGAVSGSIIGGAFPLLFGQGAGAAAGGAIGGLVGGLAGPGGSFAGSLLGTLLGDIASQGAKVKELAADIGFSADQTKRLENAFALAGQEADKFEAATQNIRGLGLSIDDQADAITLAANLTETYGGKIDKVAAAYANFVEKGKVGIADINQFTSQGIPILDALERKYKTNRDGILRMAKDGEISAQALSDALIAIGNSSDTAVKKTVTGWDKAWKDIKDGGSLLAQAVGVYFNVLTGSAASSTSSIAEYFAAMFKNIVQNSIDATAAVARQIANLARFAANISATAELGGLNIGATASKNIAKTIEQAARNYDAQLQAIALPQPGKVGAITVPGQAPPPGGGGGGGGKDRSKQIFEETLRLQNQIREAYLDQAKAAAEATEFSQGEAAAIALQLSKFNDIAKVREEILNTERSVALVSAESGEQAALINQLYDRKLQILQAQNRLEQQQLQRKSSELAVEKELAAVQRQRELVAATQDIRRQRFSTELDIAAFTTSAEEIENQRLALEQNFRWTDQTREAYEKIEDLKIKLAKQDLDKATRDSLQLDLENQQAKLALIEKELVLLDQVEQKQLRLQQFFATYGQLIQSVSGEIANAVTFGISEMVRGTKTAEQVFSEFLNAVGAALLQTAQQMIATYIAIGLAKAFAGFGGGGGGNSATALGINPNVAAYAPLANGGPTRAGTPYLVGERGPELFVPGNSGGVMSNSDLRSAMGSAPGSSGGSPVLNMSFETTRIGDTEYVSRDQLEQAMAATRRQAANDGARRGMTMTLDRIQQSPQTRSRIGIRR